MARQTTTLSPRDVEQIINANRHQRVKRLWGNICAWINILLGLVGFVFLLVLVAQCIISASTWLRRVNASVELFHPSVAPAPLDAKRLAHLEDYLRVQYLQYLDFGTHIHDGQQVRDAHYCPLDYEESVGGVVDDAPRQWK